jgi:hypothetical protein
LLKGFKDIDEDDTFNNIGIFNFTFYFLKRQSNSNDAKKFFNRNFMANNRKDWLNKFGGIKLVRDNFRVRPYGETKNVAFDWLGLGSRKSQSPASVAKKEGGYRVEPDNVAGAINILWIISHPAQLTKRELKQFDFVFAASESWAQQYAKKWKVSISTLLQATNSNLFNTSAVPQNRANNLLFVGNTRGIHRSAVRTASVIRDDLEVVGKGWEKYISRKQIKAQSLTHEQVANEYKNTKVVLCDHWSDMATQGFISNRIFDALACGATVVSDYVAGIENYFNNSVITYNNPSELEVILKEVFSSDSENPVSQEVADDIAKNHTFLNRAKALISEANKIKV